MGQLIFLASKILDISSGSGQTGWVFCNYTPAVAREKMQNESGPVQETHSCLAGGKSKVLVIPLLILSLIYLLTYIEQFVYII